MATAIEEIEVVLDVVDEFSETFTEFLFKLGQVEQIARSMDDITIDVDVRDSELDALLAKLTAAELSDVAASGGGGGDIDVGDLPKGLSGALMGGGGDRNAAAKAATSFTDTIRQADIRMSDLHNILARLVPLIIVLIGALPAVITGFVAVGAAALSAAAALGALTGLGALGAAMVRGDSITEGFQSIIEDVRSSFLDAFTPLARQLAQLFERGLRGLGTFFDEIARRGHILTDLQDVAVDFGQWAINFFPEALANMGRMVDAFAPLLGMVGDFMNEMSLLEGLTEMFLRMIPSIIHLTQAVIDLIPTIINLSIGFMRVLNLLGYVAQGFDILLGQFPALTVAIGTMVATLLVAISAFTMFNAIVNSVAMSALANLGAQLILSSGTLLSFTTATINAIAALTGYTISTQAAAAATGLLATAIVGLLATTGIGVLIPIIGGIGAKFADTGSKIDDATKSLKNFKSTADSIRDSPYSAPESSVSDSSMLNGQSPTSSEVTVNVSNVDEQGVAQATERVLYRQSNST